MSDISPINKTLSSGFYNSPPRLNSEEVQNPLPNSNNPASQQYSSQYAREDSSSANHPSNSFPCQHNHGPVFLCPHNLIITCPSCSQQLKQRFENQEMNGFNKIQQESLEKAQVLEGSLGDFKEEIKKLQKKVQEVTDPIKKTVQSWFEASVKILVAIRKEALGELDQAQKQLFSPEKFKSEIAGIENQIMVLKGGFQSLEGLQSAFQKETSLQFEIQKKMNIIQKLSNSLKNPDVSDLEKRMNEILFFDDQAIKRIRIPAFVNVILYQMADMDASTMVSSLSLFSFAG